MLENTHNGKCKVQSVFCVCGTGGNTSAQKRTLVDCMNRDNDVVVKCM